MFKNFNKSSGEIAKVLLALAIVVLIAILIAYIVIKRAEKPPVLPPTTDLPIPVYEATLGDIRLFFLEATDKGDVLLGRNSNQSDWQKDLRTTERFIEVKIGAQNIGKENTIDRMWDIGEIIDNEGRKFILSGQEVMNWLPSYEKDQCGDILKPSFEPLTCTKIYEVAKISTGLKVKVFTYDKGYSSGSIAGEAFLDILLMP